MKLIIDIDEDMLTEEEIEACIKLAKTDFSDVTVLPKGHGRLIDADALEPDYYGDWDGLCITEDKYKQSTIDKAPTIVEADK